MGSSLPISSGKALVQTETRPVSNTRREQVGWEEALRNQWANTSQVKSKLGERQQKMKEREWVNVQSVPRRERTKG